MKTTKKIKLISDLGMHNTEELAAKAYNDYIDKHSISTTKNII